MAEERDDHDKSEDPTQKRLDDALKRGDVAKSQEVNTWFVIAGATLVLSTFSGSMGGGILMPLRNLVANAGMLRADGTALLQLCTGTPQRVRSGGAAQRRAAALAHEAQVLIAACYAERVTLEGLASRLDVSPFRLCRAFRAATGTTLHRHLTDLRLVAALERLPEYRDRLTTLAFDLGFSSHSHFTHAFREYYGKAPATIARRLDQLPAVFA